MERRNEKGVAYPTFSRGRGKGSQDVIPCRHEAKSLDVSREFRANELRLTSPQTFQVRRINQMDLREGGSQFFGSDEVYRGSKVAAPRYYKTQDVETAPSNLILHSCPVELSRSLAPSLKPVMLRAEEFIYQEGDRIDFIYFPVTAVISEFKMLEDGRAVEIAVTGNEGAIGLSLMFSETKTSQNFTQVSQAGMALKLDAITFGKLLRSNDTLRNGLNQFVDLYIKQISQKAICNMYHSVKERLCTWLLMLQDRSGRSTLKLTHEQIARTLGVYRPSVTCIAQELREMKLIDYSRGGISICNRERVKKSACTCYLELSYA